MKVDPGTDANLMPIHHFRTIFPYLCDSTGQPKEGVLETAESSFESYSGDNVTVIGQTKIYAKNEQTNKFMETRIYVIARERGPILISNTGSQWLGLISVLCKNKAPVVGRFIAPVTREMEGGEVEKYPVTESGGADMTESQKSPLTERAIPVPKKRIRTKKAKPMTKPTTSASVDVTTGTSHNKPQPSANERTEPDSQQTHSSVLSGEAGQQVTDVIPGPFRTKRERLDGPKMNADSTEIPCRKYYRPTADAKTYRMNGQRT